MPTDTKSSYRVWLLGAFLVLMPLSFLGARSQIDLVLQHTPTVALLIVLIATGRRYPFADSSYALMFLFLLLHLVGARHLYSYVPYDDWTQQLVGVRLADLFGFERNHYDRFVHLMFGVLMLAPVCEIIRRTLSLNGLRRLVVGVGCIIVLSSVYEFLEWGVALVMDPAAAERYNGQQGDIWDAHKDSVLATCGAVISACVIGFAHRRACRASHDGKVASAPRTRQETGG